MENVNKLLHMLFSILIFCIGMFLAVFQTITYHRLLSSTKEIFKDDPQYEQFYPKDETVKYSDLIATLLLKLEQDIRIDGKIIKAAEHDIGKIQDYGITKSNYRKSYWYDEYDNITMVIYTGIEEG